MSDFSIHTHHDGNRGIGTSRRHQSERAVQAAAYALGRCFSAGESFDRKRYLSGRTVRPLARLTRKGSCSTTALHPLSPAIRTPSPRGHQSIEQP